MTMPATAQREISLIDILRTLNQYRLTILAFLMIGIGLALLALGIIRPVYRSEAILLIAPTEMPQEQDILRDAEVGDANAMIESQVRILSSRALAKEVLADIDLTRWNAQSEERFVLPWAARDLDGADLDSLDQAVERFLAGLSVARDGKSNAIRVGFVSTDKDRAALFANQTIDRYLTQQLSRKFESNQRAVHWLAEQVDAVGGELEAAETALANYREQSQHSYADALAVHGADVVNLQRDLATATAERAAKAVEFRRAREAAGASDFAAAYEDLGGSPVLQNLFALKNQAVRRQAELAAQYGARHPRIVDLKTEIRQIDGRIFTERSAMVERISAELEQARVKEDTLRRELDEIKSQSLNQRQAEADIQALEREVELSRTLYQDYVSRFQAVADRDFTQMPDGRILSQAVPAASPFFPNPKLVLGAAFMASLATALLFVYLREQTDRGFRTAGELESTLGLACIALLPTLTTGKGDDIEPHDYVRIRPQSRLAEALRGLLATFDGKANEGSVVLVASSMPAEGKSTTAVSLARVAAHEGLSTVLIDADLRRPRVQVMIGEPLAPGLVEILRGDVGLDDALKSGRGPGEPDILLGSRRSEAPVQVLGQDGMEQLLKELRRRYDLVLIDTAPLAAVSDARVLTRFADVVLMLVRWNKTPKALVEHSIRGLREAGAASIACVLSQVDLKRHARAGAAEAHIASRQLAAYYSD